MNVEAIKQIETASHIEVSKADPLSDITEYLRENTKKDLYIDVFYGKAYKATVHCNVILDDKHQFLYEFRITKGSLFKLLRNKSIYIYCDCKNKNMVIKSKFEALSKTIKTGLSLMQDEINTLSEK